MRPTTGQQAGFTLLEVLVAFTILALVMGALFQIFGDGLRAAGQAAAYSRAVLVAQSRLAEVSAAEDLAGGADDGETDDGYRWSTRVVPFETGEALDQRLLPVDLWRVDVAVSWGQGSDGGRLVLTTLRLDDRR